LDNHLLLEVCDEQITIRAARDNFSERRKEFFIRELIAEGYIPDQRCFDSVRWLTDPCWVSPITQRSPRADRFMRRLFFVAAFLWCLLIWYVVTFRTMR